MGWMFRGRWVEPIVLPRSYLARLIPSSRPNKSADPTSATPPPHPVSYHHVPIISLHIGIPSTSVIIASTFLPHHSSTSPSPARQRPPHHLALHVSGLRAAHPRTSAPGHPAQGVARSRYNHITISLTSSPVIRCYLARVAGSKCQRMRRRSASDAGRICDASDAWSEGYLSWHIVVGRCLTQDAALLGDRMEDLDVSIFLHSP